MPPNFGRLMLAEIGPVWTVLIGSSKDGARTFIMPCTVGAHAEEFTILGGCSLQWQGHHSPTSNYIEEPCGRQLTALANASSVPGRTQTAVLQSSGAANPIVPVLKCRVFNFSPTLAGRDLTVCKL